MCILFTVIPGKLFVWSLRIFLEINGKFIRTYVDGQILFKTFSHHHHHRCLPHMLNNMIGKRSGESKILHEKKNLQNIFVPYSAKSAPTHFHFVAHFMFSKAVEQHKKIEFS